MQNILKKQVQLEIFPDIVPVPTPFQRFIHRVDSCSDMPWASLVCDDCGKIVLGGCTKLSCLSPYCQDPECIKNRKRIFSAKLKSLDIVSKKLLHIVFGFERVPKFTKEVRNFHIRVLNQIDKEMKRLGTPLEMFACRDLNGEKGDLYVHYHCANLPVKDWRKFRSNLFAVRESLDCFSVKFLGYRNRFKLFEYFGRRLAGSFQNAGDSKADSFGYAKLMDSSEYFETFYKVRKIKFFGISPRRQPSVLALLLDNFPKICQHCGSKNLKVVPNDRLDDFLPSAKVYPPPDAYCTWDVENVEVVHVRS